jgi:hypothetical protein
VTHAYGKPSLFVTFTCNPTWKEIQDALLPGQTWEDRADIVNRVFHLKLAQFLEDLREGVFFQDKNGAPWKARYIMHVVEFQKRGKPHAHITLRFAGKEEDMPKTPAAVDAIISARLPVVPRHCTCSACSASASEKCTSRRALQAVTKHMIHKCAAGVCMATEEPRVCRRAFPKAACAETTEDDGGYPVYARGEGDANVVPHNVAMLLKYDCHINVELCTTVWVHKYMVLPAHQCTRHLRAVQGHAHQASCAACYRCLAGGGGRGGGARRNMAGGGGGAGAKRSRRE